MADKRMFSKKITCNDAFLDMPVLSQALYFHLSLAANDDGFIDSTKAVMRSLGATRESLDALIHSKFLIYWEADGVSVICHWRQNNNIRHDVYKETKYKRLKNLLDIIDDVYSLQDCNEPVTEPLQNCNILLQNRATDQISTDQISTDQEIYSSGDAGRGLEDSSPEKNDLSLPGKNGDQKRKKPSLRERSPENDYEQVEKVYLHNWDSLFRQGKVKTENPVVNWTQIRALLKNHFEKLKPEQITQAVHNGLNDDFVLKGGYSLAVMLSASVLNRLINASGGNRATSPPFHKIAADNISGDEWKKLFKGET